MRWAKEAAREPHQPRNYLLVCEAVPWERPGGASSLIEVPFFFFQLMPLPFLVSRHRHLVSAASDDDFVTPEPRRTTRRHPNTQQQVSKKKLRIVFSSDESSEEGTVPLSGPGPERAQLAGRPALMAGLPHSPPPPRCPPPTGQCGQGLSHSFS